MKLHYHPETDSLYINLSERPSAQSREVAEGIVADFDVNGRIVCLDIEHAGEFLDLTTLETSHLPVSKARRAG